MTGHGQDDEMSISLGEQTISNEVGSKEILMQ